MKTNDIELVASLGQSLWTESEQSGSITRETVSATSVLDPDPERSIERAVQTLLERANQKGMYARVPTGFNALFPEERFILLALHSNHWPYERISRVLREPVDRVQQLAWNARVYLALSRYPAAPAPGTPSCPEYDPQRPWTLRFLDQEHAGQEKLFLQTHLVRCASCRDALIRAKEVYYKVQSKIEKIGKDFAQPGLTAQLHALVEQGQRIKFPKNGSPTQNILRFLERIEVRLVLLAWAVGILWFLKNK
jgi:hypothetical protein